MSAAVRALWPYWLCIALYALLMTDVPVLMAPRAAFDDALFIRQAAHLLTGHWLGPYDNATLAKGPFYPMWIALSWAVGLPILVSQGLAYAGACALAARGLRPWLRWEWAAFLVFLILLFNPMVYAEGQVRVVREGIYVPLTLAIMAGALWWVRLATARPAVRVGVAAAIGAALAAFWMTREEGIWLLPSLALAAVIFLAVRLVDAGPGRRLARLIQEAALLGVAAGVMAGGVAAVAAANRTVYGVDDIVEFKQPAFLHAYGALSRVVPDARVPYVPVPQATLARLYSISPALAELRDHLSGGTIGANFAGYGCAAYAVQPCDHEIRAGWLMWALRAAAAAAGHHASATAAQAYYSQLAGEIDAACADGRLACLPPRATMMPPFRWDTVNPTLAATLRGLLLTATMDAPGVPHHPHSCRIDDCSRPWSLPILLDLINTDLFVIAPDSPDPIPHNTVLNGQPLPSQARSALVARGLDHLHAGYRAVLPWAVGATMTLFPILLILAYCHRRFDPLLAVAAVALTVVMARALLLGYLDTVAMPGVNTLYLSPAFPFMLLFIIATLFALPTAFHRPPDA